MNTFKANVLDTLKNTKTELLQLKHFLEILYFNIETKNCEINMSCEFNKEIWIYSLISIWLLQSFWHFKKYLFVKYH